MPNEVCIVSSFFSHGVASLHMAGSRRARILLIKAIDNPIKRSFCSLTVHVGFNCFHDPLECHGTTSCVCYEKSMKTGSRYRRQHYGLYCHLLLSNLFQRYGIDRFRRRFCHIKCTAVDRKRYPFNGRARDHNLSST